MSKLIAATVFVILTASLLCASDAALGSVKLIEGYTLRRESAVDAAAWRIEKQNGLRIEFESGPSEGSWADPKDVKQYTWYRERTVNRHSVRLALTKPGLRTVWDERGDINPGNVLLITFLLGGPGSANTADFQSKDCQSCGTGRCALDGANVRPREGRPLTTGEKSR